MNTNYQRKHQNRLAPSLVVIFSGIVLVLMAAGCSGKEPVVKPVKTMQPKPQNNPMQSETDENSWVLLDDSFVESSQVKTGAEVFRLVCSACHGDVGQGFTDEWIATWAPEDQNCWQSKCHGDNHPSDGFKLPRYSPPLKGPIISSLFENALDLYTYNKQAMPWHAPGTMQDEEYWQVTAFILDLNGIDLGDTVLSAENGADFKFNE